MRPDCITVMACGYYLRQPRERELSASLRDRLMEFEVLRSTRRVTVTVSIWPEFASAMTICANGAMVDPCALTRSKRTVVP